MGQNFHFVINDQKTYTTMADFRKADNCDRMKDILSMEAQLSVVKATLLKARNFYATATERERQQLRREIIDSERQQEMLEESIAKLEKEIRNTENL